MKTITEYLLSKKNNKLANIPKIGRQAYDWCDEEWTIVDFCCCDDEQKIKKFKHDYGECDDVTYDDDDYLVAAENGTYLAVFLWDEDSGLHYKN